MDIFLYFEYFCIFEDQDGHGEERGAGEEDGGEEERGASESQQFFLAKTFINKRQTHFCWALIKRCQLKC